jgi:5-formyltetrahydrofolate cyclo-ligase
MNREYVGSYIDYNSELSTNALHKYLIEKNFNICLPKIDYQTNEINFFKYSTGTKLIKNKYNILEPEVTNEIIFPKLVLVPLLAFNESGFRLGYGGGFYDKYFSSQEEKDIIKVGLGFSFQKANQIPIESHDQKLDWILTESYLYKAI